MILWWDLKYLFGFAILFFISLQNWFDKSFTIFYLPKLGGIWTLSFKERLSLRFKTCVAILHRGDASRLLQILFPYWQHQFRISTFSVEKYENKKRDKQNLSYFLVTLFYASTITWRGYIFSPVCLCVCLSVCLSVCPDFLWTKFQPNGWTNLDAVFAKLLLTALAQTLLKLAVFC